MHGAFSMKKSLTIYRSMFEKAWQMTWQHKELWIIAAVAGLANTGAVFRSVLRGFSHLQPADQLNVEQAQDALLGMPWLVTYLEHLVTLSPARIIFTIASAAILLLAAALAAMAAQHVLILGIDKKIKSRKALNLHAIIHAIKHAHLWRLLAVNIIMVLATTITIALGALVLVPLLSDSAIIDTLAFSGVYIIVLPILFAVSALGMLTLIQIVRQDRTIPEAAIGTWNLLRRNWLVTLETTLLLFIVNALISLLLLIIISAYALIVILLLFAAYNVGSFALMVTVGVLGVLGAVIIFLFHAGIVSCFNYSVWTQLAHRLERHGLFPGLEGIVRWVLKPLRGN